MRQRVFHKDVTFLCLRFRRLCYIIIDVEELEAVPVACKLQAR